MLDGYHTVYFYVHLIGAEMFQKTSMFESGHISKHAQIMVCLRLMNAFRTVLCHL